MVMSKSIYLKALNLPRYLAFISTFKMYTTGPCPAEASPATVEKRAIFSKEDLTFNLACSFPSPGCGDLSFCPGLSKEVVITVRNSHQNQLKTAFWKINEPARRNAKLF